MIELFFLKYWTGSFWPGSGGRTLTLWTGRIPTSTKWPSLTDLSEWLPTGECLTPRGWRWRPSARWTWGSSPTTPSPVLWRWPALGTVWLMLSINGQRSRPLSGILNSLSIISSVSTTDTKIAPSETKPDLWCSSHSVLIELLDSMFSRCTFLSLSLSCLPGSLSGW